MKVDHLTANRLFVYFAFRGAWEGGRERRSADGMIDVVTDGTVGGTVCTGRLGADVCWCRLLFLPFIYRFHLCCRSTLCLSPLL